MPTAKKPARPRVTVQNINVPGSVNNVDIPNLPQCLEIDLFGRVSAEPCTNNPDYRRWWHSLIEDQCRSYDIDGIMWCNERRSPLDQLIVGEAPGCFCEHCRREAISNNAPISRGSSGQRFSACSITRISPERLPTCWLACSAINAW